jgi:hypothetical protein
MEPTIESLRQNLLDLLIDGPSSFAALYGGLLRHFSYSEQPEISLVMQVLSDLEQEGFIKAWLMANDGCFREPESKDRSGFESAYYKWLPNAKVEELCVDEVGLWYELTPKGRSEWQRLVNGDMEYSRQWVIDDEREIHTIIIRASTIETAQAGLRWWLSYNSEFRLVSGSESVEPIPDFSLHDGTVISRGIKIVCQYHAKENN